MLPTDKISARLDLMVVELVAIKALLTELIDIQVKMLDLNRWTGDDIVEITND